MRRVALFALLFGALLAKDLEFELEILDFYDAFAAEGSEPKAEEILNNNIKILGYYEETKLSLGWDNGGGGCGRDVTICYDMPGPKIRTNTSAKHEKPSNITLKNNKIRFVFPKSIEGYGQLQSIDMGHMWFKLPLKNQKKETDSERILSVGSNTFALSAPMDFKFSLVENDKPLPKSVVNITAEVGFAKAPYKKIPHNIIMHLYKNPIDEVLTKTNPFPFLSKGVTQGWLSSSNDSAVRYLEITGMQYSSELYKGFSIALIREFRYAKEGKVFKIEGAIFDCSYGVYLFADGNHKRYFRDAKEEYFFDLEDDETKKAEIKNGDLGAVKQALTKYYEEYKDYEYYAKGKNAINYVLHVLSASEEELQKEFDAYKKAAPFVQMKTRKSLWYGPGVELVTE